MTTHTIFPPRALLDRQGLGMLADKAKQEPGRTFMIQHDGKAVAGLAYVKKDGKWVYHITALSFDALAAIMREPGPYEGD